MMNEAYVYYTNQKFENLFLKYFILQLQYEFLHRAILNYAELHNLLEDS